MYWDCITIKYLNLSYIGPLSGLYSKNISKIFLYPYHIGNVSILQWYGLIFSGQHWDFIFFSYPTRSQHTRYHNDIVPIRSRAFNAAWVTGLPPFSNLDPPWNRFFRRFRWFGAKKKCVFFFCTQKLFGLRKFFNSFFFF